jgi:catechol 1,2-dioxygenase
MQRRSFIKEASLYAVGIGMFGRIQWKNNRFTGDTPTTTDILGPYYRPGAPLRRNLNPAAYPGEILHLSGTIYKEDGRTPASKSLIEIWQCNQEGFYDNISDEYVYRARQEVGKNGQYSFITSIPVAYPSETNPNQFRPAHIHMRISAEGAQDLITQIYFKDDPHLATDPSTKSPLSLNRIMAVQKIKDKESKLQFDIALRKEYLPDQQVFNKVSGVYKMNDGSMMEFYKDGDLLFYKTNNQIWGGLAYSGNNTFTGGVNDTEAIFELLPQGKANVRFRFSRRRELKLEGTKVLNYNPT